MPFGKFRHIAPQMFHKLRMIVSGGYPYDTYGNGWTLDKERTCAIWDKGFLAFLRASSELDDVLGERL